MVVSNNIQTMLTLPQSVFTSNQVFTVAANFGTINSFNAASGNKTATLPALSSVTNLGAYTIVEKYQLDGTFNTVTVNCAGSDVFDDGTTSIVLYSPGDKVTIQYGTVGGVAKWKRTMSSSYPNPGGISSIANAVITVSNTTGSITLATATIPAAPTASTTILSAGSAFRIKVMGTVQTSTAASSTLTFTPSVQSTSLAQAPQMASQGSALGPVGFTLETLITVLLTGASGAAVSQSWGQINFATPVILTTTSTATTGINTTSGAAGNVVSLAAAWGAANASNILTVSQASIERII